ncbi:MAG: HAD-IIIA family hydrolase [Candidatus Staskawiczbacteria bacterium]|nr:HAD-IIIA family hydrolase [Candidatus Staskawiczbacteria bacterium]
MTRAVFLDRDGVLIRAIVMMGKPYPPASLSEVEVLPQVEVALNNLKAAGYILIVVTNQPDVATGKTPKLVVDQINKFLHDSLPIDEIRTCYHQDKDRCLCRKPLPGCLYDAAHKHQIDLSKSFMIGDRWRDIAAGQSAGCKTFFINYGYHEKQPDRPDYIVASLAQAAEIILNGLK